MWFSSIISYNYNVFLLITSLLTIIPIYSTINKLCRNNICCAFGFLIFLTFDYCASLNIARQYMAVAITFFAARYLISENYRLYLIFVLFACCVHVTAVVSIFLLFVFWYSKKLSTVKIIILIFGLISSFIFFKTIATQLNQFSFFNERFDTYVVNSGNSFGGVYLLNVMFILLYLFFIVKSNATYIMKSMFIFCIIGQGLCMLGLQSIWIGRLGLYMNIYQTICLPYVINELLSRNNELVKFIINLCLFVLLLSYFYYMVILNNNGGVTPYIFSENIINLF